MESNPPGQPSISYRAGTWATFKESMLARLSSSDYPALGALKTRDDNDFTVALMDATAIALDILTFYQERLANENYLRTASQLRSLTELSRLIGYQPAPGVSASTYLAFTFKAAPGQAPNPATPVIIIPKGTQVQSVPAQGQKAQTFETSTDIQAKADWNALRVQTSQPWVPPGTSSVYLSGTSTQLEVGDSLLILGVEREELKPGATPSERWDVVVLNHVQTDSVRKLTYVSWALRLSHQTSGGPSPSNWSAAKVFAFRQKAALFGHNAPNPNLFVNLNTATAASIPTSLPALINVPPSGPWEWIGFNLASSSQIDLDATYQKIVVGSWFALVQKSTTAYEAQLYKVQQATTVSVAKFGLSGKVTELSADYADAKIGAFPLRDTEVWAQSDELTIADQPLDYPLYGKFLDLEDLRPDLVGAAVVALSGNRQKITVADGITKLSFSPDDGSDPVVLNPGDTLTVTSAASLPVNQDFSVPDWSSDKGQWTLNVEDANGRPGTVQQASLSDFILTLSGSTDPQVSEVAMVASVSSATAPYPHTRILLQSNLVNCYDRNTTTVNVNVGLATHGQSVSEILGSGNASTPNQSFTLKQSPLTFVQAPTQSGRQSTLEVKANGVTWTEELTLYNQGPSQQVYATLNQPDGTAEVLFGDGVEGATLPTGQHNLQANYRIGSGASGNVAPGALTTLLDRPLGVSGVTNPEAATGGQDAASIDDLRSDAPRTVLTLGRAVSITDYQSYAATFAGIAKAYALWIPSGPGRGVFITVAGVGGAALPPANPTLTNLVSSLQDYGNPLIPITVQSFLETLFGLSADLQYAPAYDNAAARAGVQAQVLKALYRAYSFEERTFGQSVSADEVSAIIQNVPGVVAVNVTNLFTVATSRAGDLASQGAFTLAGLNNWLAQHVSLPRPFSDSPSRICPYLPVADTQSVPLPAEILVLDPDPSQITLGVMS
jgi:hypothetical protein